jgi:hypothetical protein
MSENDQTPYLEDASTLYSAGSYDSHYPHHAPIYQNTIPAPPPPDESFYVCPSAYQNIIPPFAYDNQTLEAPRHYSPRSLDTWAPSHSRNVGNPSLAAHDGSFMTEYRRYPYEGGTIPDSGREGVEGFPVGYTPAKWPEGGSVALTTTSQSDAQFADLASRNTFEVSVESKDDDAGALIVQKGIHNPSAQTGVSGSLRPQLDRIVAGPMESPEKKKQSQAKPSKACDYCSQRKIKCTGETHDGKCTRCYEEERDCTWVKRDRLGKPGEFRFEYCRPNADALPSGVHSFAGYSAGSGTALTFTSDGQSFDSSGDGYSVEGSLQAPQTSTSASAKVGSMSR